MSAVFFVLALVIFASFMSWNELRKIGLSIFFFKFPEFCRVVMFWATSSQCFKFLILFGDAETLPISCTLYTFCYFSNRKFQPSRQSSGICIERLYKTKRFCSTLFKNQKSYFNIINHKIMVIFLNFNDN